MLVHGLMGSALNYWGTGAYSEQADRPLPTRLYYVDYEAYNTQGYSENLDALHTMVEAALSDYRFARPHTPMHKVSHAPHHDFGDVRYAATRVDVVGHSMGGQIARAYISDLGNTGNSSFQIIARGGTWQPAAFGRGTPPNDSQYISPRNWGAGTFRRFIAIGSPFKGSPIGNAVQGALEPTLENCHRLATLNRIAPRVLHNEMYRKLWSDPDNTPPSSYIAPTAVADLAKGSKIQQALESSSNRYPTGRRKVPWFALVGVATQPAGVDPIPAMLFEIIPSLFGDPTVLSDLNPANSDLVVDQWSQRNAEDENDYPNAQFPSFPYHLHTFGFVRAYGFETESESAQMSILDGHPVRYSVHELLTLPRSHMLFGELH